ncbi:MAG: 50S ribosomal protein L29 [Bacteroidetes bacterium 4572_77]|nr:MAG: 50S ribosomal protein L29 [Bacteroidetes bacterium 4572_77]
MKNSEIKELSTSDIQEKLEDHKMVLNKTRLNHAISPLENPNVISGYKKTIARLQTELRSRELAEK